MCPCALRARATGVSMQKELIIATTPQETKIAVLEDDELVEYYIERHQSQGIVGNIYKGKVTKVLPGMQSAFVDIGLERDAFLYVSDFFEDTEEYEKIVSTVEDEVAQLQEGGRPAAAPAPSRPVTPAPAEEVPESETVAESAAPTFDESSQAQISEGAPGRSEEFDRRGGRRRERERDRRGGRKPKIPSFETKTYEPREERSYAPVSNIEVLPGESLARLAPKHERPTAPSEPADVQDFKEQLKESGVDASAVEGTVPDLSTNTSRDEITPTPSEEAVHPPEAPAEQAAATETGSSEEETPNSSARITDRS